MKRTIHAAGLGIDAAINPLAQVVDLAIDSLA